MITIIEQQGYVKIDKSFKMGESNQDWGDFVEAAKSLGVKPKFDKHSRILQLGGKQNIAKLIPLVENIISVKVDRTDYELLHNQAAARVAARKAICPDCGRPYEIEVSPDGQGNMYCEYCEG